MGAEIKFNFATSDVVATSDVNRLIMNNQQQSNINQSAPPHEPSAPAQKGHIKFGLSIAVVIICLVAAGVAVYWIRTEPIEENTNIINNVKPTNEIAGWQTYRNENQGFEIKIPSKEWTKDIRIDDKNPKRFDGWFLLNSAEENDTLRIKIDLFSELTPILPEQSFIANTATFKLFRGEIREDIFSTQDNKETSIFSRFCLNKELNLENPKPDFNASEATERCSQNYDLYDFNLYCKGRDSKNCDYYFNQILSTFKFIN